GCFTRDAPGGGGNRGAHPRVGLVREHAPAFLGEEARRDAGARADVRRNERRGGTEPVEDGGHRLARVVGPGPRVVARAAGEAALRVLLREGWRAGHRESLVDVPRARYPHLAVKPGTIAVRLRPRKRRFCAGWVTTGNETRRDAGGADTLRDGMRRSGPASASWRAWRSSPRRSRVSGPRARWRARGRTHPRHRLRTAARRSSSSCPWTRCTSST